jgi:hypothetical protein
MGRRAISMSKVNKQGTQPTADTPFSWKPPKLIHEFKKSELVKDMEQVTARKHWWSKKHTTLYILTSSGVYEMRIK